MARQREEARKSWVGSGEAATEAVWFGLREALGATEFLGYETETCRRRGPGAAAQWRARRRGRRRRGGRRHRQSDPVLCRVGRADGRYRRHFLRPGRRNGGDRHGQEGGRSACSSRQGRPRRAAGGRGGRAEGRRRQAAAVARQPFGHPPAARGVAPAARRPCHAERLAGGARPAALRFQPPAGADSGGHPGDRGRGQRAHPRQRRGAHAPADPGTRRRRGRARALRREIRRRSARGGDGRRQRRRHSRFRSSCAAAPMFAAPATSDCSRSPARPRSPPACAGSRR